MPSIVLLLRHDDVSLHRHREEPACAPSRGDAKSGGPSSSMTTSTAARVYAEGHTQLQITRDSSPRGSVPEPVFCRDFLVGRREHVKQVKSH